MVRVSKQVQEETRKAILTAARRLFRQQGFAETTTRDLAAAAGIAAGTLFNYFPTKEAVLVEMAAEELAAAGAKFAAAEPAGGSLEEDLFALVAAGLRRMRPLRKFLRPALAALASPLSEDPAAAAVRQQQLGAVAALFRAHDLTEPDEVQLQLYWTLYAGVLAHWVEDGSRNQEDTWALLDQSLHMFVNHLSSS